MKAQRARIPVWSLGWLVLGACAHAPSKGVEPASAAGPKGQVVAILGDSRACDFDPKATHRPPACASSERSLATGINVEVLTQLLGLAKARRPKAVFFTGDLTLGLERDDDAEIDAAGGAIVAPASGHWAKDGFRYSTVGYQKQLDAFVEILNGALGTAIPFYPVLGNHETVGPDAVKVFRDRFQIAGASPIAGDSLAYSIDLGPAHFSVIATDIYLQGEGKGSGLRPHTIPRDQLDWLRADLEKNRGKFLFVLTHEPLWMAPGTGSKGLDENPEVQRELAALLKANRVTALFCGHQHLYSRSQHDGIWQIISGGAGAMLHRLPPPDPAHPSPAAIYHYLVLTLPETAEGAARVEVRNDQDQLWDSFTLAR